MHRFDHQYLHLKFLKLPLERFLFLVQGRTSTHPKIPQTPDIVMRNPQSLTSLELTLIGPTNTPSGWLIDQDTCVRFLKPPRNVDVPSEVNDER
jgi:hypothetical protein